MKLSIFVAALSWSSIFALMWLCILSGDWSMGRIICFVIFLLLAILSSAIGYTPRPKV